MINIELNGMKFLATADYWLYTIKKYLVIVFVEDIKTGMKKEYADFVSPTNGGLDLSEEDILKIMGYGFKPGEFQFWMNNVLIDDE